MASFTAILEVKGNRFPLLSYDLSIHQETDSLGRPASPTLGGTIDCVLSTPGSDQPFLLQWMFSPTQQEDGKIILLQESPKTTLKTISFFNAFCTGLQTNFVPGDSGGGSLQMQVRISPQRIAVGVIIHDNNWPLESHGAGESFASVSPTASNGKGKADEEPSAFVEGLHGVLDVVGMIPIIGEAADLANAAIYASEGRYGEAALSAASAVPLAGNVVGIAKLGKRAMKVADKLSGVTALARKGTKRVENALAAAKTRLSKFKTKCGDPVDVATGDVLADAVDFSLPGPIPFLWRRNYLSSSTRQGALGYGWSHAYEWAIVAIAVDGTVGIRDNEGRLVAFEAPVPGGKGIQSERLALFLDLTGSYRLWHMDELLWYSFGVATASQEAPQPVQTIEDPNGFTIGFAYDDGGHLRTITDSAGRVLRLDSNAQGQLTAIHSPQTAELPSFALIRYEYDEWGNLTTAYDAEGHPMRYHYRGHQLVQRTARMGSNWFFTYETSEAGARCVHTWGDGGLLDYTLYYDSDTQTTVLDSYQQPTVYTHQDGLVTRQVDALGGEQLWTYSDSGQLMAYLDALGNITRYEYDEQGRQTILTLSDGKTVTTHYNDRGLVSGVRDVRGNQWIWLHDERGNLLSRTNPLGATTTFGYDEQSRLISLTNALDQTIHLRYDQHHNVAHIVTPDEQIRSRSYDELGRLTAITDPTGATQQRRYDRLGQLVEVQEADGTIRRLSYDASGNLSQVQQHEEVVSFTYTALGQVAQRRQGNQEITFAYDQEGRLIELTNEAGLKYRFGLDAEGNVIEEEGFDGLLRRYERDATARIIRTIRPEGRSTDYSYTADGRVAQIRYSDGTYEVFDYDEAGDLIKAQNNTTTVRLERDALGQLVRETQGDHWIDYTYDLLGQRTTIQSSLGADIRLTRDQMGNLAQVSTQSWQVRFAYDQRGLEIQRQFSGNVQASWKRNAMGQPLQHAIRRGDSSQQRTYQWHHDNQLARLSDDLLGSTQYEYDQFGALIRAQYGDGSEELRLPDAVSNLFEQADRQDRQYGPGGQLRQSTHARYTYDGEGNLLLKTTARGETWQYVWLGNGMLDKVIRPDGAEVSFSYDALGRRVSKRFKGKVTHWVWEWNKPLHEWQTLTLDGQNTDELITWLFEEDSFAPMGKLQGTTRQSILTDHLGTPVAMMDQAGQQTWAAETTTYGRIRLSEGTRSACPFRFQGQYEDVETGLYYNRFRYYAPQEGVYISQDPIRLSSGETNLYGYVADPTSQVDSLGLAPHSLVGEIIRGGESILNKPYASGGMFTGLGSPNQRQALLTHTERKFLNEAADIVQPGDHLKMTGELNPCRPGCQPTIRDFVMTNDVTAQYHATSTGRTYSWQKISDTHLIQTELENGQAVAKYKYNMDKRTRVKMCLT